MRVDNANAWITERNTYPAKYANWHAAAPCCPAKNPR
jgi:hypothetical protein